MRASTLLGGLGICFGLVNPMPLAGQEGQPARGRTLWVFVPGTAPPELAAGAAATPTR